MPVKISAMKIAGMIEVASISKVVAIDDGPAIRNVGVVVVDNPTFVVPIVSPMVPAPAEAAKVADSKAQPKTYPWTIQEKSRIRIPTGEDRQRRAVDQPGIVLRHVNQVCLGRLNHDGFPLVTYLFLGRSIQVPSLFGALTHGLNGLRQLLRLVNMDVA